MSISNADRVAIMTGEGAIEFVDDDGMPVGRATFNGNVVRFTKPGEATVRVVAEARAETFPIPKASSPVRLNVSADLAIAFERRNALVQEHPLTHHSIALFALLRGMRRTRAAAAVASWRRRHGAANAGAGR